LSSLTVCILVHDEAEEIRDCLESVAWAEEIVVAETGVDDRIHEICLKYTDRVFRVENRLNPNENKNAAFSKATGDWILCLDPDERVSGDLKEEMLHVIGRERPGVAGYYLPRKNFYFGTWLRRGGAYPDRQLRLFRRGRGAFPCEHIHERLSVEGGTASLHHPLIHYTYRTIGQYFEKLDFKADFEAGYLLDQGVRPGLFAAIRWALLVPSIRFVRRYIFKGGFLDGWSGFMTCALDWINHIVRYQKMVERELTGEDAEGESERKDRSHGALWDSMKSDRKKVLVMRTDRVGDVVLTTPLAAAIKRSNPSWHVTFLVEEKMRSLVRCAPGIDDVIPFPQIASRWNGLRNIVSLIRTLRSGRYDIAVIVSPALRNAISAFLAGIPVRVGTRYRVGSILFNRRVSHHRRPSVKHELEYNFDLLEPVGVWHAGEEPTLIVPDEVTKRIRDLLSGKGIQGGTNRLVAIHPGSGGSSANWPPERFSSLVERIEERDDLTAVLTGDRAEKGLVDGIMERAGRNPPRFDGELELVELAALYRECDIVVANSTGPLHVAMAVGTPVVGLYCNLRTCSPTRWGPYGKTPHVVMIPEDEVCSSCIEGSGKGACMGNIASVDVLDSILRLLDQTGKGER
jgi:ADP-heptose:LPS heptosyltransferase